MTISTSTTPPDDGLFYPMTTTTTTRLLLLVSLQILIGRGKPIQLHSGNVDLRDSVRLYFDEYSSTRRGSKREVMQNVLAMIKSSGGRFLSRTDEGWWIVVSDDEAVDKVEKTFHSAGTKLNREAASVAIPDVRMQQEEASSSSRMDVHHDDHRRPEKRQCLEMPTKSCFGF
mmetsp:Transcript_41213/g.114749  ORF Transcript_41213/g.114749 Transcript_41213/m.114749 type:complete len:172 (-) Transcript_41213:189-704(-)